MAPGLTDEQIAQLRDEVAAGRSPRVRISGSQFGAADAGTVRAVGDPAVDGPDYVIVRVKVNGVTDDLPFAPRELSRGGKEPARRPAAARSSSAGPARAPRSAPARSVAARSAAARSASSPPAAPRGTARRATEPPAAASPPSASRQPAKAAKRGARKTSPGAPVTITLKSSGTSWTVSAQRGAKSVAKNVAVNPGVVSAVAGLLGVPALEDAVATVNDTARVEAELRAEELRTELARVQAVLDSHRRP